MHRGFEVLRYERDNVAEDLADGVVAPIAGSGAGRVAAEIQCHCPIA